MVSLSSDNKNQWSLQIHIHNAASNHQIAKLRHKKGLLQATTRLLNVLPHHTVQQTLKLECHPWLHSIQSTNQNNNITLLEHALGWTQVEPNQSHPWHCLAQFCLLFTAQPPPLQECWQRKPRPVQRLPHRWNLQAAHTAVHSPVIRPGRLAPDSSPVPGQQGQPLRCQLECTYYNQSTHSELRILTESCNRLNKWLIACYFQEQIA